MLGSAEVSVPLSPEQAAEFAPPRTAPRLDLDAELARVPADTAIAGMFMQPMVEAAAALGKTLPSARPRYTAFKFYPVREHVRLLFEAAEALFPGVPNGKAIRKIGRAATPALRQSTLGRVVWAAATTPHLAIDALVRTYGINIKPARAQVLQQGPGYAIVELTGVHFLLDTNHVGALEGVLRPLDLRPEVRFLNRDAAHAEYLLRWPA